MSPRKAKTPTKAKAKAKTTVTKVITTTTTTTTVATSQLKNRIGIVLDESTSMGPMKSEVIAGFNAQVDAINAENKDMDTKVSLLTFSTEPNEFKILNQPVATLPKLGLNDYNPNGWTALYDAVGKMLDYFQSLPEANDPSCSFLMFIMTDGEENRSRFYNFHLLTQRIKALEATGRWTFTYLGAGAGLKDIGAQVGVQFGNTFSGSSVRVPGAYATVASVSTKSFMRSRAGGQSASQNFFNTAELACAGIVGDQTDPSLTGTQGTTAASTTAPVDPKATKPGVKVGNN